MAGRQVVSAFPRRRQRGGPCDLAGKHRVGRVEAERLEGVGADRGAIVRPRRRTRPGQGVRAAQQLVDGVAHRPNDLYPRHGQPGEVATEVVVVEVGLWITLHGHQAGEEIVWRHLAGADL